MIVKTMINRSTSYQPFLGEYEPVDHEVKCFCGNTTHFYDAKSLMAINPTYRCMNCNTTVTPIKVK